MWPLQRHLSPSTIGYGNAVGHLAEIDSKGKKIVSVEDKVDFFFSPSRKMEIAGQWIELASIILNEVS